jgi:hypothetical protein
MSKSASSRRVQPFQGLMLVVLIAMVALALHQYLNRGCSGYDYDVKDKDVMKKSSGSDTSDYKDYLRESKLADPVKKVYYVISRDEMVSKGPHNSVEKRTRKRFEVVHAPFINKGTLKPR